MIWVLLMVGLTIGGTYVDVDRRTLHSGPGANDSRLGLLLAARMGRAWPTPEPPERRAAGAADRVEPLPRSSTPRPLPAMSVRVGDSWRELVCSPPFTWPCEEALAVFACESDNFRDDVIYGPAEGGAGERGIAQIHPIHAAKFYTRGWTWDDAFRPERNLAIADQIWLDQGWAPWTCWYEVRGW